MVEKIIEKREQFVKEQPEFFRTMISTIQAEIDKTVDEKLKAKFMRQLLAFQKLQAKFERNRPKFMADTELMKRELNSLK